MSEIAIIASLIHELMGWPGIIGGIVIAISFMAGIRRPTVAIATGVLIAIGLAGFKAGIF
jgi:hypothetical protein